MTRISADDPEHMAPILAPGEYLTLLPRGDVMDVMLHELGLGLAIDRGKTIVVWHPHLGTTRPTQRADCIVCGAPMADHYRIPEGGDVHVACPTCGIRCIEIRFDGDTEVPWPRLQEAARRSVALVEFEADDLVKRQRLTGHMGNLPLCIDHTGFLPADAPLAGKELISRGSKAS